MNKLFATLFLSMLSYSAIAAGYFVISKENAENILQQCSRDVPRADNFWTPTKAQIVELEKYLERLSTLDSDRCCNSGKIVGSPKDYPRQYVGVIVRGKQFIYINAGASETEEIRSVCDGGKSFWGALYDPESKTFSELAFNGEA